jgi:D-tyrosyl-tRNA(Tyr) deacylase
MNLSVKILTAILCGISIYPSCLDQEGNRPYIKASKPEIAVPMYEEFVNQMKRAKVKVQTGFWCRYESTLLNDGPVTILIDSKNRE